MQWNELSDSEQLKHLLQESESKPFVIFKHSTRCSISMMAKSRVERQDTDGLEMPFYYLDLLRFRQVSNEIAEQLNIEHQSPQMLLVENGRCIYHTSHSEIDLNKLREFIRDSQN